MRKPSNRRVVKSRRPTNEGCEWRKLEQAKMFAKYIHKYIADENAKVLFLDGIDCRTTHTLHNSKIETRNMYSPNTNREIVAELESFGVNTEVTTLEKFVKNGPQFAACYLDMNCTPGGSITMGRFPFDVIGRVLNNDLNEMVMFVTFSRRLKHLKKHRIQGRHVNKPNATGLAKHQLEQFLIRNKWRVVRSEVDEYHSTSCMVQYRYALTRDYNIDPRQTAYVCINGAIMGCK